MARPHRRISKGRLLDSKENYLVALFRFDESTGKVNFEGIAMSVTHASEVLCGKDSLRDPILRLMNGKTSQLGMRKFKAWYPVKLSFPAGMLMNPTKLLSMVSEAHQFAEIKLQALFVTRARIIRYARTTPAGFDGLKEALEHVESDIRPIQKATSMVKDDFDEWNTLETFDIEDDEQT